MAGRYKCAHITNLADFTQPDIDKARDVAKCSDCYSSGPNLWLCLTRGCLKVGCGEAHKDHSTAHNRNYPNHCVHLNLSTLRLWCYRCEREVFLDMVELERPPSQSQTVRYSPPPHDGDSGDSSDTEGSRDESGKPRGLTGLQNIGNTCYMNSALQALSNTPPLTQFFLDCGPALVAKQADKKPGLSKSYHRLIQEMWHRKRPGYVVPSGVLYGIRIVHPMFRGYQQHDTQEFLRCFMDQLHEELKEPILEVNKTREPHFSHVDSVEDSDDEEEEGTNAGGVSSQSEGEEYETCDSGVSERSSLSEEGDRVRSTTKRKSSRSPSPTHERGRSKLCPSGKSANLGQGSSPSRPASKSTNLAQAPSPTRPSSNRKRHTVKHRSIISDVFDGKLLSSVQCLTCDRVSTRVETFQDLSLPIPSRDHVHMIHQGTLTPQKQGLSACSDVYTGDQGWATWLWEWVRSWFWGPTVSLHDCLAAFFSADELKGDNMYSCERCNKLRNGVKYSKVLELPEVLCIHLKRFRHELMFSAKIGSYVTFPLDKLDMRPYMHKDCVSAVTSYDLVSVICHHGTAGGGHYTCYSFNQATERWFEFDDQYVTQVSAETVQNCEAYVLFYKKSALAVSKLRSRAVELIERSHVEPGLMRFYVSKQWVNRFNTFAEPGPIDNSDFLCHHGGVLPARVDVVDRMCTMLSQTVWEYLYDNFGGGPACNCLYECAVCGAAQENTLRRVRRELEVFMRLNKEFQAEDSPPVVYAIAMSWFRQWQHFVQSKDETVEPPGHIDNSSIVANNLGQLSLKPGSDYAQLSEELWQFFHRSYGGGPELALRSTRSLPRSPRSERSRSTENIAATMPFGRTTRAQSFSSSTGALRTAATMAARRLHPTSSDQCLVRLGRSTPDCRMSSDRSDNNDVVMEDDLDSDLKRARSMEFRTKAQSAPVSPGREGDSNHFAPISLSNVCRDVSSLRNWSATRSQDLTNSEVKQNSEQSATNLLADNESIDLFYKKIQDAY